MVRRLSSLLLPVLLPLAACSTAREAAPTAAPTAGPELVEPVSALDLQGLIDKAKEGDVLKIPKRVYVLSRGLRVEGRTRIRLQFEPGSKVLVDDVDDNVLTILQSEDISVTHASLSHKKPLQEYSCDGSVIAIRQSNKIAIEDSELNGCGAVGVDCADSKGISVVRCFVHHNTFNAFTIYRSGDVLIRGNVIEDNANTLQADKVDGLEMADNLIRRNGGYWNKRIARPGPRGE